MTQESEQDTKQVGEAEAIGPLTVAQLFRRFDAADAAWMDAIRRSLRGRAGDVRYTKAAHGEPGTPLRAAYEEFERTGDEWRRAVTTHHEKRAEREDDGVGR